MKTVRIQKAPKYAETRYVALTESGQLIQGYARLSDIRKTYRWEIKEGLIRLQRELDRTFDASEADQQSQLPAK